ncbi:MAG: hypothetical protein COB93_00230 [Sneathiella sp.]|nr:MAG: hypothetical protein COB93_00230 [Sneathiella sp.]
MALENVSLRANGGERFNWKEITVTAAMKDAARSFSLSVTEPGPPGSEPFVYEPGTEIEVLATGDLILAGYVGDYDPKGSATDHSISVTGKGKGIDFVQCSAVHPTGRIEQKDLLGIANELNQFGVTITCDETLDKEPAIQIPQGDTPFNIVSKLCARHRLVMMGQADGSIKLTRAGKDRHSGDLVQGKSNILSFSSKISDENRHSEYIVKGQVSIGTDDDALSPEGRSKDEGVTRYRPKIIIPSGSVDKKRAQEIADWERDRAAGEGRKASLTVSGWRDGEGLLWEPSWLVSCVFPWLRIDQDMLIERVTFKQGADGTTTEMALVDPRAYGGKSKGNRSSQSWSMPE